jgi:asparagine synthase (glutamine-hydrolysing)
MSAIAGAVHFGGRDADSDEVLAMRSALAHRGPDGAATWVSGPVGLAHLLKRTIAETGAQPLVIGSLTITGDVRLDNRGDLLRELKQPGSITDEHLVLAAYARWAERCPEHLLGDFAFAIWDSRRHLLFCARDHFGVRQLYYRREPNRFAFSTEIRGLLALPDAKAEIDEEMVASYIRLEFDQKRTLYQDVFRLPAAHTLTVTTEGQRLTRYWTPESAPDQRFGSDAEYADAFRAVFTTAVEGRLRSSGRIGATLSGGLDSSSVTCVARDLLTAAGRGPLASFSARYRLSPECDEGPYIEAVREHGGLEPHDVFPEEWSPLTDWEEGADGNDEPLLNPQMSLHWAIYQTAQQAGIDVILDGYGGDSSVSHGVGRLIELTDNGRWLDAWSELHAVSRATGHSRRSLVRAHIARPLTRRAPRTDREQQLAELASPIYTIGLGIADRAAARNGVEPRYPYLDPRLIEFCVGLPSNQKLQGGLTRAIVRRALAATLPTTVAERGHKANLSPTFIRGLESVIELDGADPLGKWVQESINQWRERTRTSHNTKPEVTNVAS